MKTNLSSAKASMLTIILLLSISHASIASSFIASFSGNWSNTSNWDGNAPGFNIATSSNVVVPAGVTLTLDADLTVNGTLQLNGGTIDLNGQNLTIGGGIATTGLGSIIGNKNSNITFNGYGGAGNLVFSSESQIINNLTINIGSNSGMFLGSGLTVCGTLSLVNGYLGLLNDNLVISEKGSIQGGSRSSYIMTSGTATLAMNVPNSGISYIFQVGTQNDYAPVAVTNNSAATGMFVVSAFEGVLAQGCTGNDISGNPGMINTSWNISSAMSPDVNVNLEMFWTENMQVNGFDNTQAYVSQYTATGWNAQDATTATLNGNGSFSLKMTGVTSFGQFAVFGKNAATAIKNVAPEIAFSLYPNPATNFINVSVLQTSNYPLLKIFDAAGNQVISQQVVNNLTALDINSLSQGIYFASLNGATAQRFIKE